MHVALFLPDRHRWPTLVELARAAEAAHVDQILMPEITWRSASLSWRRGPRSRRWRR